MMTFFSPEIIGYTAATLTTASFLPQALMTLKTRNTDSLSLGMYSAFTLGVLLWMIYGIKINDMAIIIANAITFLLSGAILIIKLINVVRRSRKQSR